jgi:hypothetical protein
VILFNSLLYLYCECESYNLINIERKRDFDGSGTRQTSSTSLYQKIDNEAQMTDHLTTKKSLCSLQHTIISMFTSNNIRIKSHLRCYELSVLALVSFIVLTHSFREIIVSPINEPLPRQV